MVPTRNGGHNVQTQGTGVGGCRHLAGDTRAGQSRRRTDALCQPWRDHAGADRLGRVLRRECRGVPGWCDAAARHRDVTGGLARPQQGQSLGQRDRQADDRHGSLGRDREMVAADDGYGDCEDYVLLKRKMLIDAGWPREALLITVVRDKKGEGHAVLTVKTDKGEFILDNQNENVVAWTETGYRFVKRQSQSDPNVWVSLGDNRPAVSTASSH